MTQKALYRKKPVVIEAIQWDGTEECLNDVMKQLVDFSTLPKDDEYVEKGIGFIPGVGVLEIPTLEGTMAASPGDWIIKGVAGEIYPCKPDIFEATYTQEQDGDFITIGPECFANKDGSVICWKGENYVPQGAT